MELIRTAAADPFGNFCLILESLGATADSPSVVLEYLQARPQPWRRYQTDLDLVAVARLPDDGSGGAAFIAMSGSGDVIEITETLTRERIAGAGFSDPDSSNLGRMTRLQVVEDKIMALGFGGQAYLRKGAGVWAPVAAQFPRPGVVSDTYKFLAADVVQDLGAMAFAGNVVTGIGENAAIDAANDADDADLLVELMLQETRPDSGAILILKGGSWSEIEVPFSGEVDGLVADSSGAVFVWVRDGQIYSTRDFTELSEIAVEDTATGFSALDTYNGKALAATEVTLVWLDQAGTTAFDPAPPVSNGNVVDLAGDGSDLFMFRSASILRLRLGVWQEITPPTSIASLG